MKKQFTTQFAMMFMAFAFSFVLAGCGEDIISGTEGGGGIDTTKTEIDTTKMTVFSCGSTTATRTTMNDGGVFFWEEGDQIWVDEDENGTFTLPSSSSELSGDKRMANFFFRQKVLTNPSYNLTYTGKNSTSGTRVTIAATQTQSAWNNADHIGSVGDCGIATATPVSGGYEFTLRHQASYLVFQPYKVASITDGWKLMSIEIIDHDGNSLCGTYGFGMGGLNVGSATSTKDTITLKCANTGFTLPTTATSSCFAVIQPGTHNLRIKYNIQPTGSANGVAGGTFSLIKELDRTFSPNGVTIIRHELSIRTYSTDVYYMWDARNPYWFGVSNPPTFFGGSNTNYPKSDSDTRWCNTDATGTAASRVPCRDLPNANMMTWYAMAGDPRWDEGYPWCFNNDQANVCSYGVWILKKQYIMANEGVSEAYMNGVSYDRVNDARVVTFGTASSSSGGVMMQNYSTSYRKGGRPSTADLDKYFFLPALGRIENGAAMETPSDIHGRYWSSTASPSTTTLDGVRWSYYICFSRSAIWADHNGYRQRGRPAVPDWFQ